MSDDKRKAPQPPQPQRHPEPSPPRPAPKPINEDGKPFSGGRVRKDEVGQGDEPITVKPRPRG